jgi:hypothetical protein
MNDLYFSSIGKRRNTKKCRNTPGVVSDRAQGDQFGPLPSALVLQTGLGMHKMQWLRSKWPREGKSNSSNISEAPAFEGNIQRFQEHGLKDHTPPGKSSLQWAASWVVAKFLYRAEPPE